MEKQYIRRIEKYWIEVDAAFAEVYLKALQENRPLTPEIAGLLFGKAQPVYQDVFCKFCGEKIEEGMQATSYCYDAHKACEEKEASK